MFVYKIVYSDGYIHGKDECGIFTSKEKAEEVRNEFLKYEYLDNGYYDIIECRVDVLDSFAKRKLDDLRNKHQEYIERIGAC